MQADKRSSVIKPYREGIYDSIAGRLLERVRRAFTQFLAIPLLIVAFFVAVAIAAHIVDKHAGSAPFSDSLWRILATYVGDPASATSLLSAIASSLITVTSITFSILLLAVQQGASALTSQIIDSYLDRRSNQLYFGFFVGASIYTLVTLVLTTSSFRPVLGVTLATVFAAGALFALILLIYSTIDQIKPVTIIGRVHDAAITSKHVQLQWLAATSSKSRQDVATAAVLTECNGYLSRISVKSLESLSRKFPGLVIEVLHPVGAYLACGTELARIPEAFIANHAVQHKIRLALPIEEQRDIKSDPAYAVSQLTTIAWTAISTAKSNPAAGLIACHALGDLLFRWSEGAGSPPQSSQPLAVVYHDQADSGLLDGLESLLVVASESMQHQSASLVIESLTKAFPRMPKPWKQRTEQILLTSLSGLGDFVPVRQLGKSLMAAVATLEHDRRFVAAEKIRMAWEELDAASGKINARGNRGTEQ